MSSLPSPLKSPTRCVCQLKRVPLEAPSEPHQLMLKELPVERPTHQEPSKLRPAISALPSPLKSPTSCFCHKLGEASCAHNRVVVTPPCVAVTYQSPFWGSNWARSALPSPLKSPTRLTVL